MAWSATPALWFLPFVIPIAIWAAYSDISRMKIPNKAVLALLGVFLFVGAFVLPFSELGYRALHFIVILIAGFVVSSLGLVGAGDAKFAAAMAPFIALSDVTFALLLLAGCIIFGFITHRLARSIGSIRNATPDWVSWTETRQFPMGYPLALMLVIYLAVTAF